MEESNSSKTPVIILAYYAWPRTYPSRSCKRNPWREHMHRATRRRSQAIDMAWRHVALATTRITWRHVAMAQEIVSRHKHNMLSLLYATCLKLLVFFFFATVGHRLLFGHIWQSAFLLRQYLQGQNRSRQLTTVQVFTVEHTRLRTRVNSLY